MKKTYETPNAFLDEIQMDDVIRTSLGNGGAGNLDDNMILFGDVFYGN